MRKLTFILASCIFLVACYTLYSSLEATTNKKRAVYERGRKEIEELESRLKQLQDELGKNEQIINDIRQRINSAIGGNTNGVHQPIKSVDELKNFVSKHPLRQNVEQGLSPLQWNSSVCSFSTKSVPSTDVQMLDAYEMLKFDNPDGGVWKQGWDIVYDKTEIEQKSPKLLVYVIPHSHTDPGWIQTFEKYYQDQTRNILDNVVAKLPTQNMMKFIYAEISFFERWWRDAGDSKKEKVKQLLDSGQFEIATGAWVMTDEANSHYFSMIDQMIEGNQWLENHLNYKPKNHWSIDPFGLSPTMAYLLKLANFTSMTIQRIHYSVKKSLARDKNLEFMWRQLWNSDESSDIFCHVFPFYSYDIPHTCGPDPKICCQFDFRRLSGSRIGCPWHVPPVPITDANVEERATTLLDQYRKKAQLYKTNVLLIPLGDDFRYDTEDEWNSQYENYQRLFAYMNNKKDWNVQAQFGTLEDYFHALYKRTETTVRGSKPAGFPVLSGDFFTYADRDDHYWSGYYTSRPFYKRMDRVLQHYLRGAEIVFALSLSTINKMSTSGYPLEELFSLLVNSRRNLGLFQHHDGVTGTAKDVVVVDYGSKLLQSIQDCRKIISASAQMLLISDKKSFDQKLDDLLYEFDDRFINQDSIPEKIVLGFSPEAKSLIVYNSLGFERNELVCVHSSTAHLKIVDTSTSLPIETIQINPVIFKDRERMEVSSTVFEVCFIATVPALGMVRFTITESPDVTNSVSSVTTNFAQSSNEHFKMKKFDSKEFTIRSMYYTSTFNANNGFLTKLKQDETGLEHSMDINFVKYGTTSSKDKSGAYLFLPDGSATDIPSTDNRVLLIEGPLFSAVHVVFAQIKHVVELCHFKSVSCQSLKINNLVDIAQESNYELAMRIKSDLKNTDRTFYTDLNGFQIIKRKYFEKLTLQGNVYPMPTAAYLEDKDNRLTLLSAQPLGVASMNTGWLEVFLDRRLMQDDNRGLFQSIVDNKVTPDHFRLVLENRPASAPSPSSQKAGYHTLIAHLNSLSLSHPLFVMYNKAEPKTKYDGQYSILTKSLPCDVHLVNIRTLESAQDYVNSNQQTSYPNVKPKNQYAILFHRIGIDCSSTVSPPVTCNVSDGTLSMNNLFNGFSISSLEETTLSMMYTKFELKSTLSYAITLQPMDIKTYKIKLE